MTYTRCQKHFDWTCGAEPLVSPDYLRLVNGQISEFLYVYITDIFQTSESFGKKAQINHLLNLNTSALRNNYVKIEY